MNKNLVRLVSWLIIWLAVVGVYVLISAPKSEEQVEQSSLLLIQGNTLIGTSPVEFPHTLVLASMITDCESGDRHEGIWGDSGMAYGRWQFWEKTFYWLADLTGYKNLNWKNEADQDRVGMWALENGYGYLWTCFRIIINK